MPTEIDQLKKAVTPLLKENDVSFAAVFGSFARGRTGPGSDVDLLVRFAKPKGLLDFARLERLLAEALHADVDLVTENSVSPYLRDRIFSEAVVLYGTR